MKTIIILSLLIATSACSRMGDYQDALQAEQFYCSMVDEWEADTKRGISEEDRGGWPPFRGPCNSTQEEKRK